MSGSQILSKQHEREVSAYASTQAYMASAGLPGALLPLVIALELAGGLALLVGFKTRWAALALAAFPSCPQRSFIATWATRWR